MLETVDETIKKLCGFIQEGLEKQHGDSKDQSRHGQAGKRTGIENATSTNCNT